MYNAALACQEQLCTIYSLSEKLETRAQVQKCPICPPARQRFIGPDGREAGIFNYNNSIMFSHELLDEYTCSFTTSETPLVAWAAIVSRRYALTGHEFVSDPLLRSVWFAYVRIQHFENDMLCVRCGPTPEDVIWDGVTLAFGRKHVLDSLKPPTATEDDSPVRQNHKYVYNQQILPDRQLRDLVRKVIAMPLLPALLKISEGDNDLTDNGIRWGTQGEVDSTVGERRKVEEAKAAAVALEHISRIELATEKLTNLDTGLGTLFRSCYGVDAYQRQYQPPSSYRRLFQQVRRLTWILIMS
jgi:CxC4 like cysteine cluster associated with KDZ transposases